MGSLCDREVACSASDLRSLNFETCVWREVPSHSSHHPQEVLLTQFSLYVQKSGPFHFIYVTPVLIAVIVIIYNAFTMLSLLLITYCMMFISSRSSRRLQLEIIKHPFYRQFCLLDCKSDHHFSALLSNIAEFKWSGL